MHKSQLGNIYELLTNKGIVYLHLIHINKKLGDLVRVLPGFYDTQPDSFEELIKKKEQFLIHFPVTTAGRMKIVKKVGKVLVENFEPPKYMRSRAFGPGRKDGWFIVNMDTFNMKHVDILSDEQKELSPSAIWNDTALIEKLEGGFSLDNWV